MSPIGDSHSLGCHGPCAAGSVVFDNLVSRFVLGGVDTQHVDGSVSATTIHARRAGRIRAEVVVRMELMTVRC